MLKNLTPEGTLARSITKAASWQADQTIRLLVDRDCVTDAYCAYAYFRWVDDIVDAGDLPLPKEDRDHPGTVRFRGPQRGTADPGSAGQGMCVSVAEARERRAFLERQKALLDRCYRGKLMPNPTPEEQMLIQLVQHDHESNSGLQTYLCNMMKVMEFDAERRGRLISESELHEYTRCLASAVTEAMHYFIGHDGYSPHNEARYLAVSGAHIVHMLRDAYEDVHMGYYNIPREVLQTDHIRPYDIPSQAYRAWVESRVQLARKYFKAGKAYIAEVEEIRCRLAGLAYIARFEWLLVILEQEAYIIRPEYSERKRLGAKCRIGLLTLSSIISSRRKHSAKQPVISRLWRKT